MTTPVFNVRPVGNCLQLVPITSARFATAFFNTPCDADDEDDFVLVPPPDAAGGGEVDSCVFFPVTRVGFTPARPTLAFSNCNSGGFTLQNVTVNTPAIGGGILTGTYTALRIPVGASGCYQITISLTATGSFATMGDYVIDLTLCSVINNSLVPLPQFPTTTASTDDVFEVNTASVTGIICLADGLLILPCISLRGPLGVGTTIPAEDVAIINVSMTLVRLGDC